MSHPWSVRKKHSHYCLVELYARCFTARMAVKWQSAKHPVKNLQALLILSYLSSHIEATSRPILTTDWTIRCRTSLIGANPRGKLGKLRPTFKRSKIVQCEASLTFKMWDLAYCRTQLGALFPLVQKGCNSRWSFYIMKLYSRLLALYCRNLYERRQI